MILASLYLPLCFPYSNECPLVLSSAQTKRPRQFEYIFYPCNHYPYKSVIVLTTVYDSFDLYQLPPLHCATVQIQDLSNLLCSTHLPFLSVTCICAQPFIQEDIDHYWVHIMHFKLTIGNKTKPQLLCPRSPQYIRNRKVRFWQRQA